MMSSNITKKWNQKNDNEKLRITIWLTPVSGRLEND